VFISKSFAERQRIHLMRRPRSIPLRTVNGKPISSEGLTHFTEPMELRIGTHTEQLALNVIPTAAYDVILGTPWLRRHEPHISWANSGVHFLSQHCVKHLPAKHPTDSNPPVCFVEGEVFEELLEHEDNLLLAGILTEPRPEDMKEPPHHYREFADLFCKEAADALPAHQAWDHTIPLTGEKQPPFGPIYALSATELTALRDYLDENLVRGFIQPSTSPAGAPILFVKKKDGGLRLCVDYRGLNNVTIKNRYALPLIAELVDRLQGVKYFTKIDLRGAYNLVRIAKGEEWKTAFRTRYGHFEYKVMPFGLTNAPASFQSLVNSVLQPYLDRFAVVYLDDILIYSRTLEDHIRHVKLVLRKLRAHHLFIKLEKCQFHVSEVDFLGLIVGANGVRMDPAKVAAIAEWPPPKSLTDLQSFLGFANFYRRFVPNYSKNCCAMTNCLRTKAKTFEWISEAQTEFDRLKILFTTWEGGVLAYYDPRKPCIVETDASNDALGGCISQLDDNGRL